MMESNASAAPAEPLCRLCQMMPVEPGRPMCRTCWQLAPVWVRRSFKEEQRVEWSHLLENDSIRAPQLEDSDGH